MSLVVLRIEPPPLTNEICAISFPKQAKLFIEDVSVTTISGDCVVVLTVV